MAPLVTSHPSSARGVRDDGFDNEALAHISPPMLYESNHKQTDASLPLSLTSPRPAPPPPSTSYTPTTTSPSTTRLLPPPPLSPPPIPGSTNLFFYASRTPMQLVTLSNIKLNNDIYSTRSLSILRRVLVKNLLTLLYDTNPMLDYWFEDAYQNEGVGVGPGASSGQCGARGHEGSVPEPLLGEDEQNGWIEQTLNAAGLNDDVDDDELADPHRHHQRTRDERNTGINNNNNNNSTHGTSNKAPYTPANPFARSSVSLPSPCPTPQPSLSPSISRPSSPPPSFSQTPINDVKRAQPPLPPMSSPPSPHSFMSFPTPIPRAPRSASSPNTPSRLSLSTSRPKSAELPQFLNSYLSAVFDVDWSVGLPSTEDSLFIQKSSLSSSPPVVTSYLSSPKRISDSSASVSSFSSRSSTASLSSSMTSVEGGSQKSVEELPLSKGKLWDENGSIPIPLLSKPTPPLDANASSNKSHIGKSILVKKSQPSKANGNSASNGTTSKGLPIKGEGGIKKKSSPPLPAVSTLKIQNNKPKATLVPGRRSSLMQTGQLPAVSSPNTKGPLATSTPTGTPPTIEVTAPISTLSFPTVPSTIPFPVGNTVESAANTSQSSPKFARRTSSLTSERTGYQNRKALSSESLIAPSNGLPRPLGSSGSSVSAVLTASQSSGGTTAIALSNFPSAPTGPPQSSYGTSPDGTVSGRTATAGWIPSDQPQEHFLKQKTYNSYVIHTAPIAMPTSPSLLYSEPAGFPPSRSRSPPQAPRQLAIVSSAGNGHSSQLPPSSSPPPRSPSRSQSSAPTLPSLFPMPPQDQSYGSNAYSSSPISLDGHRQEQCQKSQQQYLLPPYTFARSVSDDELQSRSYNASSTLSPPVKTRPAASYSIKTSRSSPDLMSSSDNLSYNNSGGLPPLPNTPAQYHNQHQQGQAYQYPGSHSRTTSVRKPIASFISAPLPQIPSFKGQVNSSGHEKHRNIHHGHGYGSKGSSSIASTRWNSMKSMLGLKSGSGKA